MSVSNGIEGKKEPNILHAGIVLKKITLRVLAVSVPLEAKPGR